jgi:hypothetical protein
MEHVRFVYDISDSNGLSLIIAGTGEHGVGVGKRRYLEHELGKGTVDLMRTIKKALDPNNMMNPGKVCLHCLGLSDQAN